MRPVPLAVALLALPALIQPACISYHSPEELCVGVTCSGHGTCVVAFDQPVCACDPGWVLDPADQLACLAEEAEPVIVDLVTSLSDPVDQQVVVGLKNHPAVGLVIGTPMTDLWRDILAFCLEYEKPVYLELDPDRLPAERWIIDLEQTLTSPVVEVRPAEDGVEVLLVYSAAIHFLSHDRPGYGQMLALLEASVEDGSSLVITEKDQLGIIDVRPDAF